MEPLVSDDLAKKELEKRYDYSKKILEDKSAFDDFLLHLEKKLADTPKIGEKLKKLPILISMVKSYITKEYTEIPTSSIIAIVAALVYVLTPTDIIPDVIPGIGIVDDAGIVVACCALVEVDIDAYIKWRDEKKTA